MMTAVSTIGGSGSWLKPKWIAIATINPGTNAASRRRGYRSASARDKTPKIAVVPPCSIAVPSPRTSHSVQRRGAERAQVGDVLDQGKPRTDGKPVNRRVDKESDTPASDERDEDAGLQDFFEQRRIVVRDGAARRPPRPNAFHTHSDTSAAAPPAATLPRTARIGTSLKLSIMKRTARKPTTGSRATAMLNIYFRILTDSMASRRGACPSSNAIAAPIDTVSSSVESRPKRKSS